MSEVAQQVEVPQLSRFKKIAKYVFIGTGVGFAAEAGAAFNEGHITAGIVLLGASVGDLIYTANVVSQPQQNSRQQGPNPVD